MPLAKLGVGASVSCPLQPSTLRRRSQTPEAGLKIMFPLHFVYIGSPWSHHQ